MAITSTRLLERKQSISVGLEAVNPGTTAAAFKSFPCYEISCTPEIGFIERDLYTSSLAPETVDAVGTQFARVTFKCDAMGSDEVTGGGTTVGAPQWTEAMLGCGFYWGAAAWADTGSAGAEGFENWNILVPSNNPVQIVTSHTVPAAGTDLMGTVSIKWWSDGRQYLMTGCMGNVSLSGTAGDLAYANFEFLGVLTVSTVGSDPAGAFDATVPTPLSQDGETYWELWEATVTETVKMSSWELNMNNAYDIYKDTNVTKAGKYCTITERKPTLTTTTLAFDGADADLLLSKMITDPPTTGNFQQVMGSTGSGKVNSLWLGARKTQITSLDSGEENGYLTENATSKCIATGTALDEKEVYLAVGGDCDRSSSFSATFPTIAL